MRYGTLIVTMVLGIYSGLPLALVGSTLQVWYTEAGIDIVTIGYLSLVGMPYLYKFLSGPLLDYRPVPTLEKLGRRRSWILLTQAGLVMSLLWMSMMSPALHPMKMGFIALLCATFSAIQDTALDAYRTEILKPAEYGIGSALFTGAYRFGMLVSGALGLVLVDWVGWQALYIVMAVIMASGCAFTLSIPQSPAQKLKEDFVMGLKLSIKDIICRRQILLILLFIMLYKVGDAFALALMSPFFVKVLHFTPGEVGVIYKTVGFSSTLAGAFVGGLLLPKIGIYRSLFYFGIAQGVSNVVFLVLYAAGHDYSIAVLSVSVECFCGGLATTAFVAYLMTLCNKNFTATQYSLFSALSSVGRVLLGPLAGYTVEMYGWEDLFIIGGLLSIPGIVLLILMKRRIEVNEEPLLA